MELHFLLYTWSIVIVSLILGWLYSKQYYKRRAIDDSSWELFYTFQRAVEVNLKSGDSVEYEQYWFWRDGPYRFAVTFRNGMIEGVIPNSMEKENKTVILDYIINTYLPWLNTDNAT